MAAILQPSIPAQVTIMITSPNSTSERRVTLAWTLSHFKSRLEPITGIPPSAQKLAFGTHTIEASDEDATQLQAFAQLFAPYAELSVTDLRPPSMRANYTDLSEVEKYELPIEAYEARSDSVLAWKKAQQLGRFNPEAPAIAEQRVKDMENDIETRGLKSNQRCRLLPSTDARLGTIAYIGPVPQIPNAAGPWVGVALDEPTGKNNGSVDGVEYFKTPGPKYGVFVRSERLEVGDFPRDEDLLADSDMEEM